MLLRTVVLLLSVSVVMCATLGHYQAQAMEEEKAPVAVEPTAVNVGSVDAVDSVDAAEVEVKVPTDAQVSDSTATEELAANILAGDPASDADTPEVAHSDAEKTEQDHPGTEKTQVEVPDADETELDTLESDKLEVEVPVTAEEPGTDGDDESAGDAPAVEALSTEAITTQEQQQPSDEEEKEAVEEKVVEKEDEGNDIKPVQTTPTPSRTVKREETSGGWGLNSIRSGFQGVHGYFESLVELVGGQDGVCQYRCRYGELPQPRPGYQQQEPNGCSNSLVGYEVNDAIGLDIPAMTKCCNVLDVCYDTCGVDKYDCDNEFRSCLHGICSDLNKSLGFVSKVEACESMADTLYNTVWTLGCRPYMNSQRAACICEGEERDEL